MAALAGRSITISGGYGRQSRAAVMRGTARRYLRDLPWTQGRIDFGLCIMACFSLVLAPWVGAPVVAAEQSWNEIGGGYGMHHFSPATQVNEATVARLGLAWRVDFPGEDGSVANPLVVDGVIYVSSSRSRVWAFDLEAGERIWSFEPRLAPRKQPVPSQAHRGIAIDGDRLFVGTIDCRLIALDRADGSVLWEAAACDTGDRISITAAPRVGGGLVYLGNTVGETNVTRPYIDAYDQATGRRAWRFYTSPPKTGMPLENRAMELARPTWDQDYLEEHYGGGGVWGDITYDPVLGQVVFGTQNPQPEVSVERGTSRGDELFTASILALDAKTGSYRWHFKQTPNDTWGYDSTNPIAIANLRIDGRDRRVLLHSPKNGIFYVLDAATGKFLSGKPILPVTWAMGIDQETGRPIENPAAHYELTPGKAVLVQPGQTGARGWHAMSFSPETGLVYLPAFDARMTYRYLGPGAGTEVDYNVAARDPASRGKLGFLIAWDPIRQEQRWRVDYPQQLNGGVLSTAGNLVFQGTANGTFIAYSADTGRELWSQPTGSSIQAAPTSVMHDGVQYIIVNTGATASVLGNMFQSWAFGPDALGTPQLLVYKLDGSVQLPPDAISPRSLPPFPKPSLPRPDASLVARGKTLYGNCVTCHGVDAEHWVGRIPDLRRSEIVQTDSFRTVLDGAFEQLGMPSFKGRFSEADIEALQAYILAKSWAAFDDR
jgi:quinohemoprotein ethanol dehydrogenase